MKVVIALALVIVAVAAQGGGGGGDHHHHHLEHYIDYQGHPKYHFDYAVHDPHTHDEKSQWEERDGHHLKGGYTLVQPDGKKRIVKYESDKHGINYHVSYSKGHHESGLGGGSGGSGGLGGF